MRQNRLRDGAGRRGGKRERCGEIGIGRDAGEAAEGHEHLHQVRLEGAAGGRLRGGAGIRRRGRGKGNGAEAAEEAAEEATGDAIGNALLSFGEEGVEDGEGLAGDLFEGERGKVAAEPGPAAEPGIEVAFGDAAAGGRGLGGWVVVAAERAATGGGGAAFMAVGEEEGTFGRAHGCLRRW